MNPGKWQKSYVKEVKDENGVTTHVELPGGVRPVAGEGTSRDYVNDEGQKFAMHYGDEVNTGVKGRKYAKHDDLMPKERQSKLSMEQLRKMGFDAKKHLRNPLFFLMIMLPLTDCAATARKGFWDKVADYTNIYSSSIALGAGRKHKYVPRNEQMLIRWFGTLVAHGLLGGKGGTMHRRFRRHIARTYAKI